ncbi:DUF7144 family membrane protein [Streptomyces sp. A475]|uniref:DUF7144 family membrane protein n=1 Tax=Streptomyces sp. A475 TaxID=3131976 RepID=UPI0040407AA9
MNYTAWGWTFVVIGVLMAPAGIGVFVGSKAARRSLGVTAVGPGGRVPERIRLRPRPRDGSGVHWCAESRIPEPGPLLLSGGAPRSVWPLFDEAASRTARPAGECGSEPVEWQAPRARIGQLVA